MNCTDNVGFQFSNSNSNFYSNQKHKLLIINNLSTKINNLLILFYQNIKTIKGV
jgi:hypothetical protein